MKKEKPDFTSIELHKDAEAYIAAQVAEFSYKLTLQAKLLARDDQMVLKSHVVKAYRIITTKMRETWTPELLKFAGAAFVGAGLSLVLSELSLGMPRIYIFILAFLFVIVGASLEFLGVIMENRER